MVELLNPQTNKFLRTVHHPLALVLAFSSYILGLDEAATFVVISNMVQMPSFIALATGRHHLMSAVMVTPVKMMVGMYCIANLLFRGSSLCAVQIIPIFVGVAMQVKGGMDLARKGLQMSSTNGANNETSDPTENRVVKAPASALLKGSLLMRRRLTT